MVRSVKGLIGLLALYHVCLLGRGALAWPDEHLYGDALCAVDALAAADVPTFARCLTGFGARPAEATLRLLPAALQAIIEKTSGLSRFSPASLRVAVAPNVVTSIILCVVFYKLSLLFFRARPGMAALATGLYALLGSNHVWIRHLVPYDAALMINLIALLLCLRIPSGGFGAASIRRMMVATALVGAAVLGYAIGFYRHRSAGIVLALGVLLTIVLAVTIVARGINRHGFRQCLVAGLCAGFGLATYPAYYSFAVGLTVLIALGGSDEHPFQLSVERLGAALLFGLAVAAVLFGYEVLSRLGGVSYLGCAIRLSRTITQGSFAEGFIFLPKYLLAVEGPIGAILVALGGTGIAWMSAWAVGRGSFSRGEAVLARSVLVMAALYLVYGAQSTLFHRMTFTGRYIRMYVPFVVWAAVFVIDRIRIPRWRQLTAGIVLAVSVASFISFPREYARIDYPADVLYRLGIGYEDLRPENIVDETEIKPNYDLPVKEMTSGARYVTRPNDDRFAIVNFGFLWLDGAFLGDYNPPPGARLLYEAPHFLTFRTSVFEAYPIWKRRELRRKGYRLKVYRLADESVRHSGTARAPSENP